MDTRREQIAEVLLTAAMVGAGFATGNPVIAGIVGGIGVNWATDLSQKAWGHACRRLLGASGLLNHNLQQAMVRAFRQAIDHLERSWWQRPQVDRMRRREPDVAALALHEERLAVSVDPIFCSWRMTIRHFRPLDCHPAGAIWIY